MRSLIGLSCNLLRDGVPTRIIRTRQRFNVEYVPHRRRLIPHSKNYELRTWQTLPTSLVSANNRGPGRANSSDRHPIDAGWSSQVAREAHNLEVAGSNPVPAICSKTSRTLNLGYQSAFDCEARNHGRNPVPYRIPVFWRTRNVGRRFFRLPKYRLHKAKQLAVVTIRGRDIYLGPYGSAASRQEYRRLMAEYFETGAVPRTDRARAISTIEVVAAYLRFANGYYRKNGKVTREYGLFVECCRFLKPLYGRRPAAEFGPLRSKVVRQKMIEADHSRKFINDNVDRIRRMFKWAAGGVPFPPMFH